MTDKKNFKLLQRMFNAPHKAKTYLITKVFVELVNGIVKKKIQLIGIRDGKNLKLYVKNIKKETKVDTML